jgi:hypothetical protein
MDDATIEELHQHIATLRDQVVNVANEIRSLLEDDLPLYVERVIKKAFVGDDTLARNIDDDALRRLKADIKTTGADATQAIMAKLANDALWFPDDVGDDDSKRSIAANTAVWGIVSEITTSIQDLMDRYEFPSDDANPLVYRPPSWFIGRRYLPSLSEKYWRYVRALSEASQHISEQHTTQSKDALSKRWDDV